MIKGIRKITLIVKGDLSNRLALEAAIDHIKVCPFPENPGTVSWGDIITSTVYRRKAHTIFIDKIEDIK